MRILLLLLLLLFLALLPSQAFSQSQSEVSAPTEIVDDEIHCLALNIYFEARSETLVGQLAVAMVSMNRVKSRRYPSTVCKVVWQPRQFSWTHDGKSDRPRESDAWDTAMNIAKYVYLKYWRLPAELRARIDITHGALHYYAPHLASPYWANAQQITREIGRHVFLRKKS